MSIGAGIAIAGIWLLPAACALSRTVTGAGFWIGCAVAGLATWGVLSFN